MQPQPSVPQHPQQPQQPQRPPGQRPGMPDEMDVPESKLLRYLGVTFVSVILAFVVLYALHAMTTAALPKRVRAPLIEERFVFRPEFESADGKFPAGTAFAVTRDGDDRRIVLTAVNLFRTSTGEFPRDIEAHELPEYITRVNLKNAFDDQVVLGHASHVIPIPEAAVAPLTSKPGDVAAFILDANANVRSMPLGAKNPEVGQTIWMVAPVLDGAPKDRQMHRAQVTKYFEEDMIYRFENADLNLNATSGAPLVNELGEVVGIHLGHAGSDGGLTAYGNPVERFAPFLQLPPREEPPKPDPKKKTPRPKPPAVRPPKPE